MSAYRNRPDRRKAPINGPTVLTNPILTFTATCDEDGNAVLTFSEPIIFVEQDDPVVMNSIRVWFPGGDFQGTSDAVELTATNKLTLHFTFTPGLGDMIAIWVFDVTNQIRGAATGARCTGNPAIFEVS